MINRIYLSYLVVTVDLNREDLKDILQIAFMFVKSICVGDKEAVISLIPSRKGILIDPEIYNELRIKDIEIITWDNSLYNSDSDAYTTITLNSIGKDIAEAIVAYTCLRNGLEASYKIYFMKNGRWRIENLEILTIS